MVLIIAGGVGWIGMALAQTDAQTTEAQSEEQSRDVASESDQESAPNSNPVTPAAASSEADSADESAVVEETTAEQGLELDAAEGDLDGDAALTEEMQATMERFEPSEKISEDRSISFPNDI